MKKQNSLIRNFCLGFIFVLLVQCNSSFVLAQEPAPQSLYDRLGGVYSVAAVVDDFIDRLLSDSIVTANKNVTAAMQHITKAGLKFLITEMVCEAAGGPQKYTGRSMKESHKNLNISETEWAASVKDFVTTLEKFKVPEKEKGELLAIVGSTKSDIVAPPKVEQVKAASMVEAPAPDTSKEEEPPLPELPGLPGIPAPPGL